MSFFLFSFQVHEKTILVPLLPISMLAADEPRAFFLAVDVACFSMFPLLKKDELVLAFFVLLGFWNWSVGRMPGLPRGDPVSLVIAVSCAGTESNGADLIRNSVIIPGNLSCHAWDPHLGCLLCSAGQAAGSICCAERSGLVRGIWRLMGLLYVEAVESAG